MSLINQMLQDLESRPGDGGLPGGMYRDVRATGALPAGRRLGWLLLALALCAVAAGGYLALTRFVALAPAPTLPAALSLQISAALLAVESIEASPAPEALPQAMPSLTISPATPAAAPAPAPVPVAPPMGRMPVTPAPPAMEPLVPAPSARDRGNPLPPLFAPAPVPERARAEVAPPPPQKEATARQLAEIEFRRGVTAVRQGRSAEGITLFERALTLDPSYADARRSLIAELVETNNIDAAIPRMQEGLAANRADSALAMTLARIQLDRGQAKAAIETLSRSLPYDRERAENHAFMAGLLQKENRHREAIDYYLNALRKAPRNAVWWMGVGISLQAEKRIPEARDAFSRAAALGGLSPDLQTFVQQRLDQLR